MARGTTYFSDEQGREWNDETLWAAAEKQHYLLPHVLIGGLKDSATVEALVDDYLRIKAILDNPNQPPIILTPDGRVADGFHRCAARRIAGHDAVHAVQLDAMPAPDRWPNQPTLPSPEPSYAQARPIGCAFLDCTNDAIPGGLLCVEHRPIFEPDDKRNCPTCVQYIKPRWDCSDCGGTGIKRT